MKLYHGTNVDFQAIDLRRCKPNKDFGRGFYLTDIIGQARDMAVRKCDIEGKGMIIVQRYNFDEQNLTNGELSVLRFATVCEEWAEFILKNRMQKRPRFQHTYDVVIGPIADDGVVLQLNRYAQGMIDLTTLVRELTYRKLNNQYFFGTDKGISMLIREC